MSNKRVPTDGHMISGIFVFFLIGFFAIASIVLVLTGINVYRHVTEEATRNTDRQLALSYLCNKVHAYDKTQSVLVDNQGGIQFLCLRESIDEEVYETRIYFYQGTICEQYVPMDAEFNPELGDRLTEVKALQFKELTQSLLQVEVTLSDESVHDMYMALRSSEAR